MVPSQWCLIDPVSQSICSRARQPGNPSDDIERLHPAVKQGISIYMHSITEGRCARRADDGNNEPDWQDIGANIRQNFKKKLVLI